MLLAANCWSDVLTCVVLASMDTTVWANKFTKWELIVDAMVSVVPVVLFLLLISSFWISSAKGLRDAYLPCLDVILPNWR